MKPLVSVIITTFNREHYLKLTLDSVVNQSYQNLEIIVVDDGSTTNKAKELCDTYEQLCYYKIDNSGGPATPRNYGFKKSKGSYIAFLDDDDLWRLDKIEKQVKVLVNNPGYELVHSYCDVINEDGELTGTSVGRPSSQGVKHGNVSYRMIGNWTLMMPTPLVKRSLINEAGLFNTSIPSALEDVEFWTRCSFYTKFYYLDEPLAMYRVHNNNLSSSSSKYIELPLYLKKLIDIEILKGVISRKYYNYYMELICKSQAKHIKSNTYKTLINLFKLNRFWFLKLPIIKVVLKILFK